MPLSHLRLLIRADAGPQIGTGHVMRMLALAQAFARKGGEVMFAVAELPESLQQQLQASGFPVTRLPATNNRQQEAQAVRELMALLQPDWVALDGYDFDDAYQSALAGGAARLLVMDDHRHAEHQHCDLLVNQNLDAATTDYAHVGGRTILAGAAYTMLREEFIAVADRVPRTRARRVLVTFGGADPENWTLRTLQVLADLQERRLAVDCVIGAAYPHVGELESFKRQARLNLRIHSRVERMSTLMARADLAITAGGSTCYELARCGVPAVVVAIADNQVGVARALDRHGAMLSVDREEASPDRCQELARLVRRMIAEPETRHRLSRAGRQLVDGFGAARIVNQMAGRRVQLRAAVSEDLHQIWLWRNDPEVRSVSFQSRAIALEEHRQWFDQRLVDARSRIWMATLPDGQPLGQVRFSLDPDQSTAVISVVLDQAWRCRGWGAVLISAAVDQLLAQEPIDRVIAQIKPGNAPSERAFQRAGFLAIEPTLVPGGLALQYCRYRHGSGPRAARVAG